MNCREILCKGKINLENSIPIRTGNLSSSLAHVCEVCGRLHFLQKNEDLPILLVFRTEDKASAFWIANKVVYKSRKSLAIA